LDELVGVLGGAARLDLLGVVLQARLQLGQGLAVFVDGAGELGGGVAQAAEGLARALDLGNALGGQVVGEGLLLGEVGRFDALLELFALLEHADVHFAGHHAVPERAGLALFQLDEFLGEVQLLLRGGLAVAVLHCLKMTKPMTTRPMAPTIMRLRLRMASRAAICRAYSSTLSIPPWPPGAPPVATPGTAAGRGVPHWEQVVALGRFWCPHFGQETIVLSFVQRGATGAARLALFNRLLGKHGPRF
jgi:hypothetical protein